MKNNKNTKVIPIRNTTTSKDIEMIDKDDIDKTLELEEISEYTPDYICPDCDIIISKISILRDSNNNTYMNLVLSNLGNLNIKGVYFRVTGSDSLGGKLGEHEYSLIDLDIPTCTTFETGGIKLFDNEIHKINITITKIIDNNYNAKIVETKRLVPIPKLSKITDKLESTVIEILNLQPDEVYFQRPIVDDLWVCTCGSIRKDKCPICGRTDGLDSDMNEVSQRIKETINNILGDIKDIKTLEVAVDTRNRLDRHMMTIAPLTGYEDVKAYGIEGLKKLDKLIKKLERKARRGKKPLIIAIIIILILLAVLGVIVYQNGGIGWIQSLLSK